jgi:hypothetical protein
VDHAAALPGVSASRRAQDMGHALLGRVEIRLFDLRLLRHDRDTEESSVKRRFSVQSQTVAEFSSDGRAGYLVQSCRTVETKKLADKCLHSTLFLGYVAMTMHPLLIFFVILRVKIRLKRLVH